MSAEIHKEIIDIMKKVLKNIVEYVQEKWDLSSSSADM